MKLGLLLPAAPDIKWTLGRQAGVNFAVTKAAPEITGLLPPWDLSSLQTVQKRFTDAGYTLHGLEGDQFDMSRIKLGLPGRDDDLEQYCHMLANMGRCGIGLLCYNFMAGVGWYRSDNARPGRGGALTSAFRLSDTDPQSHTLQITEDALWANYEYFLRAVLPAAEDAGVKMALHPDDPPVSPLLGFSRILTSANAYRRALALSNSPAHGIAFCQATFKAMGEDVFALIEEFGRAGRIHFVHLRDIEGNREDFVETFHDNGPTDLTRCLRAYYAAGVDCLLRPDHAPTMAGEDNSNPGYGILGRLFAIGYFKGALDAAGLPYE